MAQRRIGTKSKQSSRAGASEAALGRVAGSLRTIADALRQTAIVVALEAVATYGSAEDRARAVSALRDAAHLSD